MTNLDRNLMKALLTGIGSVLLLMAWGWAFWFLVSCQRDRPEIIPPSPVKTVSLYLFAAGFCGVCREELPHISYWHQGFVGKDKVRPIIYFIAGNPATKPATQSDADEWNKGLTSLPIAADRYAKIYRKYYKDGTSLPATVIADEAGKALKIYQPGKVAPSVLERDIGEILSRSEKQPAGNF